jgi:hypothetical protein
LKISDRVDNDVSQIDFSLQVSNGVYCSSGDRNFFIEIYQQMCMKSIEAFQSHTFITANRKAFLRCVFHRD